MSKRFFNKSFNIGSLRIMKSLEKKKSNNYRPYKRKFSRLYSLYNIFGSFKSFNKKIFDRNAIITNDFVDKIFFSI